MSISIIPVVVGIVVMGGICWWAMRILRAASKPSTAPEALLASISANARGARAICAATAILMVLAFVIGLVHIGSAAVPAITRGGATVENAADTSIEVGDDGSTTKTTGATAVELAWRGHRVSLLRADGSSDVTDAVQAALYAAIAIVGVRFFDAVARTRRPFEEARARELLTCASLAVVSGFMPIFVGSAIVLVAFPLAGYDGSWAVGTVAWPQICFGLIAFIFARIFQYGCLLQEQDDALL